VLLKKVFERFIEKTPVSVMFRGILENALPAEEIDRLFLTHARRGYARRLLFSQVVDLTALVVTRIRPRIHSAFQEYKGQLPVRIDSVYDKLQRIEPHVSATLVRHVAGKLAPVIDSMQGSSLPPVFPGYRTKILDGKHLDGTERRLRPLRAFNSVPLPGQLLVVLDAERRLVEEVLPCEDAYTQERALVERILPAVRSGEVWIEDRNFCTTRFAFGVADRGGFFVVRKHASGLHVENQGKWKKAGRTDTGRVSQASWRIADGQGRTLDVRAVRIELDQPTQEGDTEIVVVTNLPAEVRAKAVAQGYLKRWTIEGAFGEVAAVLEGEIDTLAYPKAALFCFCVALVAYNVLSTIRAALRVAHGMETVEKKVSVYFLALEIRNKWEGMAIAIEEEDWSEAFASLSSQALGKLLVELAAKAKLDKFPKSPRGPKKKTRRPSNGGRYRHLSTARLLNGQNPFGKGKAKTKKHTAEC
jgi:IS4 transposase